LGVFWYNLFMNDYITFTLLNGLKIIHLRKLDSNIVSLTLAGAVGALVEEKNEIGASHFVEHLVLKKSKKYPNEEVFSDFIKGTGGVSNGMTNYNIVYYPVSHTKKFLNDVFDFISQVFLHPLFDLETFEREKRVIVEESKRAYSDVEKMMFTSVYEILTPEARLKTLILGTPEDIHKISFDSVISFHKKWYIPENFILGIVSSEPHEKIKKLTEKYFESETKTDNIVFSPQQKELVCNCDKNFLKKEIHFPHLKTDKFLYAFAVEPLSELEEMIITEIGFEIVRKRLYDILRAKNSLVYSVKVQFSVHKSLGVLFVLFDSAPENRTIIQNIFQRSIQDLLNDGISDAEFERGRSRAQVRLEFLKEKSLSVAQRIAELSAKKRKLVLWEDYEKFFDSMTKESIEMIIKKFLSNQPVEILATSDISKK